MGLRDTFLGWPVVRQLTGEDPLGRGAAAQSKRSASLVPRTATADRVAQSVCPYCAVGCGQLVYVKDEKVVQIEGDPGSPISRGRLCPKGSASEQLVNSERRQTKVLHTFFRLGDGTFLAFFEAPDMPFEFKPQHDFDLHIALEVEPEQIERMLAKGKAAGIETRGVSDHGFIRSIYFRDPNGYVIELTAKAPGHDRAMDPSANGARDILARWHQAKAAR